MQRIDSHQTLLQYWAKSGFAGLSNSFFLACDRSLGGIRKIVALAKEEARAERLRSITTNKYSTEDCVPYKAPKKAMRFSPAVPKKTRPTAVRNVALPCCLVARAILSCDASERYTGGKNTSVVVARLLHPAGLRREVHQRKSC